VAAVAQAGPDTAGEAAGRAGGELGGLARHGAANLVGVAVAAVAAFGLNIVVTRNWSQTDAGLFFAATSNFMIAYAASRLGTGLGAVYFISRYRTLGQPERIRAVVLVGLLPVLGVGTAIAVAGWFAAPALSEVLFKDPPPQAATTLRLLLLFVPFAAAGDFALAACRGFGRMRPLLLVERFGRNLLQVAGVALAAVLALSATFGLPLTWVAPYLPTALLGVVWLFLLVRRAERRAGVRPHHHHHRGRPGRGDQPHHQRRHHRAGQRLTCPPVALGTSVVHVTVARMT
jgi:O-antigen/teichoic acid export membrane protein